MKCKYCNYDNIEESNFCSKCGKSLKTSEEKVFTKPINKNKEKLKKEKVAKIFALIWILSIVVFLLTSTYGNTITTNGFYPEWVSILFWIEIFIGVMAFVVMFFYAVASLTIPGVKSIEADIKDNYLNKLDSSDRLSLAEQIETGIEDVLFIPKQRKSINGAFGIIFFIFSLSLLVFALIALNQ